MARKTLVPEGFREDLPFLLRVTIGGVVVEVPYMQEDVEEPCYLPCQFMTLGQAVKFLEPLANLTESRLKKNMIECEPEPESEDK